MFKKYPEDTSTVSRSESLKKEQSSNTLLNRFTSFFKSQSQNTLESANSQCLTDRQILDFWFQKQTFINAIPNFANSTKEKQLAIRDVLQFLQTPGLYNSQTLNSSYKIILSDLNCLQMIINSYPHFFATIPRSLILDQQFIVALATHNPDVIVIWSVSLFEDFTPIQLYDPIHNSLSLDWVLIQHFRDLRAVVMKTGMVRKTVDLLDLWLLNLNWIASNSHKAKSFTDIQEKFFRLDFEPKIIHEQFSPPAGFVNSSPVIPASERIPSPVTTVSSYNPFSQSEDDTQPSTNKNTDSVNNLFYLSQQLVGKKCLLEHPNHGKLDIIVTGITDRCMEFVIISGTHLGRNSSVPKDVISSCLVVGNEDSRILNTNIIQVKK